MKFECDRIALEAALSMAAGASGKSTNLPILGSALIEFSPGASGELWISTTDLEISLVTRIPARGVQFGKITTPVDKLLSISRTVPVGAIAMELLEDSKLQVRSGKSKFLLPTIPAEEFPEINCVLLEESVVFDPSLLAASFRRVHHAAPPVKDTFSVPGIFLHPCDSGHRMVAVDGHRLSYFEMADNKLAGLPIGEGVVIPTRAAIQIAKLIDGTVGPRSGSSIAISDRRISLSLGATIIASQLLESEFPDYKVIIPDDQTGSVTIPREELEECLKRLALCTTKSCMFVKITVFPIRHYAPIGIAGKWYGRGRDPNTL